MRVLPRTDRGLDIRVLVKRQEASVRYLPRMSASCDAGDLYVASMAQRPCRFGPRFCSRGEAVIDPQTAKSSGPPATAEPANAVPLGSGSQPDRQLPGRPTRLSRLHVGLLAGALVLVLLVVFLAQNARTVRVSFLGAEVRLSLAVAMLAAAVAGALIMGAAGAARIAQIRRRDQRDRRIEKRRSAPPQSKDTQCSVTG